MPKDGKILRTVTIVLTSEDGSDECCLEMCFSEEPEGDKALENRAVVTAMMFLKFFHDKNDSVEDPNGNPFV